jgi:cytochrome b
MTDVAPPAAAVRVWDLPIRVFHWTLTLAVIALVVTGKVGGNAMEWHFRFGYAVFALLLWRVLWGFAGSRWARFASFPLRPSEFARQLRGASRRGDTLAVGHSPSGALSVVALLAALSAQVTAGLLSWDDIVQIGGPLNRYVSEATASRALWFHKAVGQWLVIGLALLHVAAVLFYLLARRLDLVRPMWHGDKRLADASLGATDDAAMRWRALRLMALSAAGVTAVVSLG